MSLLGLEWGMPADAAAARLGLVPLEQNAEQMAFGLDAVVARISAIGAFCPSLFLRLGDACEGRLHLGFREGVLSGADLRFRFPFEAIGKPSDGLSDLAMAAFARVELQDMLFEFIARYGPPAHSCEGTMRWELAHPVGITVFHLGPEGCVQLRMGHDGGGVVGALRYLPSIPPGDGL